MKLRTVQSAIFALTVFFGAHASYACDNVSEDVQYLKDKFLEMGIQNATVAVVSGPFKSNLTVSVSNLKIYYLCSGAGLSRPYAVDIDNSTHTFRKDLLTAIAEFFGPTTTQFPSSKRIVSSFVFSKGLDPNNFYLTTPSISFFANPKDQNSRIFGINGIQLKININTLLFQKRIESKIVEFGFPQQYSFGTIWHDILPGDANVDGYVDLEDFNQLKSNFGQKGPAAIWQFGDFNFDKVIDLTDHNILKANFGRTDSLYKIRK